MNKRAKSNTIRVIGGQWRGRRVPVLDRPGLRPTADRVRETLFNWLMYDVQNARCLDLYAGTGILGLEALSRGARFVQFVENEPIVAAALRANLEKLHCEPSRWQIDITSALQLIQQTPTESYNLVFIDPPFAANLLDQTIKLLHQHGWLHEEALLYIEEPATNEPAELPPDWLIHRQGKTSQSRYRLCSLIER